MTSLENLCAGIVEAAATKRMISAKRGALRATVRVSCSLDCDGIKERTPSKTADRETGLAHAERERTPTSLARADYIVATSGARSA